MSSYGGSVSFEYFKKAMEQTLSNRRRNQRNKTMKEEHYLSSTPASSAESMTPIDSFRRSVSRQRRSRPRERGSRQKPRSSGSRSRSSAGQRDRPSRGPDRTPLARRGYASESPPVPEFTLDSSPRAQPTDARESDVIGAVAPASWRVHGSILYSWPAPLNAKL